MNVMLNDVREAYYSAGLDYRDEVAAMRDTVSIPWSLWKRIASEGIFKLDYRSHMAQTGCQWRMLPMDFPPHTTVQGYFYQRVMERDQPRSGHAGA